ncbi:hypothetical protein [Pseudomonas sp. KCJK9111]|uniref:hypothetical protein n=1 Tax=Pseudomonas sp. KCJK9111 TaxID=3344555 RepID=UPI00390691EE
MTRPFDIALFLSGVLTGSKATQQRHLRQARVMQAAIQKRWQRDNPCTWQLKHVRWFLTQYLKDHSDATRYYYLLTASLVWKRLGKDRDLVIAPAVCRNTAYGRDDVREIMKFS